MGQISKLGSSEDLDVRTWARDVRDRFNNYIQVLDVPVSKNGIIGNYTHGRHPAKLMVVGDSGYFGFVVPHALAEFKQVTIRLIANTTGTINYTVNLSYGGVGQNHAILTKTLAVVGRALTDNLISELDITSLFTGTNGDQNLDDQVGVEFVVNALAVTVSVDVLTLYIKYI